MRVDTVTRTIYVTPDGAEHAELAAAEGHATDLAIEKLASATVEDYRAMAAGTVTRDDELRLSFMWFARHVAIEPVEPEAPGIGHNGGPALEDQVAHVAAQVLNMDAFAKALAGH